MSTLFELLPIGAYRSTESGRQLRANAALVRLNGYDSEAEMLAAVNDISLEWYVVAGRRDEFKQLMQRDGQVVNFVSEIYRHKSRELCWIREFAHVVRDTEGKVLYYEGTVEDITAEHAAEIALQASEKMLREITNEVPGMLYQMVYPPDVPGRYTFISSGIRELYHVESGAAMADSAVLRNMRHPEDRDRVNKVVVNAIQRRIPLSVEFRIVLADGTTKWVHMASTPAGETAEGAVRHGVMTDITDHKNAQAELNKHEERWKLALDSTGDGVWDWHIQEGVEYYSQRYKEMYGYSQDKVWQTSDEYRDLVHPDDKEQLIHDQQAYFNGLKPTFTNERRVRCADGSWKWVLSRGMVISRDANGKPLRMIGTHTDISDRKSAEALIWSQANFDPLTGLPNRRMLRDRMLYAMRRQPESGQPVAVLFIDLDHFKEVNDALGHDSGDLLLVEAAHRIANCLGPQDTVARMGGDEFTVVLASAPQGPVLEQMLQNILGRLSAAFQLKTEQVFVSASIGIAGSGANAFAQGGGFAHGAARRTVCTGIPADRRPDHRRSLQGRSPVAVAASATRTRQPGRFHRHCRNHRTDHRYRRMGFQGSRRASQNLAGQAGA
jgi:diguanylate cyclase (GGDEF)-like protein/PAS domain S-box-containing protein